MGQALYRKYRSKSLAEVVGQEHITRTLEQALKTGRISHAYLFTGPRGVGKTSIARILAHEINKLPYDDDSTYLDIIEIDAASNRRIDEIRELRDKANVAPSSAPYKVYIIDEVHMLTKEAFNALLKTLEEPPQHVVFILATTEAHKLPETIVSRTQQFSFKPVSEAKVAEHLRHIAEQEGLSITDDALALIARHGEGSFRDSISLLDQATGQSGEVDLAAVQSLIGLPPLEMIDNLRDSLLSRTAAQVVQNLIELREHGYQPAQIAKQLGVAWRANIVAQNAGSPEDFALLQKLLDTPAAHNPERYLEIVLLEFALAGQATTAPPVVAHIDSAHTPQVLAAPTAKPTAPSPEVKAQQFSAAVESPKTPKPATTPKTESPQAADEISAASGIFDASVWPQVLAELKKQYNTLYGIVRMAQPEFHDDALELGFKFAFHRKRLSEAKNQQILTTIIKDLTGASVSIRCIESTDAPAAEPAAIELAQAARLTEPTAPQPVATPADLASISSIFGGGEVLPS